MQMFLALAVLISTGAVNPNCTKAMACTPGYSASVRPPESWTNSLKRKLLKEHHLPGTISEYELDHFVMEANCGAPRDEANLWMQPMKEAKEKDRDEMRIHHDLCHSDMTIYQAADEIKKRWRIHYP